MKDIDPQQDPARRLQRDLAALAQAFRDLASAGHQLRLDLAEKAALLDSDRRECFEDAAAAVIDVARGRPPSAR